MLFWEILFIASCSIAFYNYAGYALIIWLLNKFKKSSPPPEIKTYLPSVSFIVAAYNEEDFIQKKIENSLEQDYPRELIEFIFITDGSTDNTAGIISRYPPIQLMHEPARRGKSAAINRAVQAASNDILIFSDANTMLNKGATAYIARHYHHPRIGGVAGEKKVVDDAGSADGVGVGEGLYWKYESTLKKLDSDFYSVVGAAGELFSLRRELYEPIPDNIILDDFVISIKAAQKGYRIVYEPQAYAMESPSFSLGDEKKRKVRIAAGGFQAIGIFSSLLYFWKQPKLSFLYISHRLLRWTLSPLCFILAFVSNAMLCIGSGGPVYQFLFAIQLLFYCMAILGFTPRGSKLKAFKLPYYFTFMNLAVVLGFFRFIRGRQSAVWEKAKRSQPNTA
ncbi:MAG TPA: glycosyltransferase family 2 protein [Flavisolibacter sp.]|nr:glycosyltransferase family 2 protein [Flavisolibacter sp.]